MSKTNVALSGATPRRRISFAAAASVVLAVAAVGTAPAASAAPLRAEVKSALQDYLAQHRADEGISTLSAFISRGKNDPGIAVAVGTTLRGGRGEATTRSTLFQIGSNTKAFTSARILQLEAEGRLDIDDTVGDWLPQYPAWASVRIRDLLRMTAPIPTYSEAPAFMKAQAADMFRHYTPEELVAYAYPRPGHKLPVPRGWFYSNTNYTLAEMIIEKVGRAPYAAQLEEHFFKPLGLKDTYYAAKALPQDVLARASGGYFWNTACSLYQPNCKKSLLAPLFGKNLQRADLSWAGAAGGIVSTPRDVETWVRALFGGEVLPPRQMKEMMQLVSMETGRPIARTTAKDARAFGLGIGEMFQPGVGRFWFYEGETLGYRTVYAWYPQDDLVIVVSVNSQPTDDHIGALFSTLHEIVLRRD